MKLSLESKGQLCQSQSDTKQVSLSHLTNETSSTTEIEEEDLSDFYIGNLVNISQVDTLIKESIDNTNTRWDNRGTTDTPSKVFNKEGKQLDDFMGHMTSSYVINIDTKPKGENCFGRDDTYDNYIDCSENRGNLTAFASQLSMTSFDFDSTGPDKVLKQINEEENKSDWLHRLAGLAFGYSDYETDGLTLFQKQNIKNRRNIQGILCIYVATSLLTLTLRDIEGLTPVTFSIIFLLLPPLVTYLEVKLPHNLDESTIAAGMVGLRLMMELFLSVNESHV